MTDEAEWTGRNEVMAARYKEYQKLTEPLTDEELGIIGYEESESFLIEMLHEDYGFDVEVIESLIEHLQDSYGVEA